MSTSLTIAGAALEIIGLGFVFAELAVIRSHEFGVPTPWARLRAWMRRVLHRPRIVEVEASMSGSFAMSARGKVRPGDVPADASDAERIERLERYVEHLDRDVDGLHEAIKRKADEIIAKAKNADDQLREEIARRDEERLTALRPSLQRQAFGAACVFGGVVLGVLGTLG
jgi:hypothetical protein